MAPTAAGPASEATLHRCCCFTRLRFSLFTYPPSTRSMLAQGRPFTLFFLRVSVFVASVVFSYCDIRIYPSQPRNPISPAVPTTINGLTLVKMKTAAQSAVRR
jgi:hypothetical protein